MSEILDYQKRDACMALFSALVQEKVDFSNDVLTPRQLSKEQISYLKALLYRFATFGKLRNKMRTSLRDFSLDLAAQIQKSNNPEKLWKTVDQDVANQYSIPISRVTKARRVIRKSYFLAGISRPEIESGVVASIGELQLSAVDFEKISDLFPEIGKL